MSRGDRRAPRSRTGVWIGAIVGGTVFGGLSGIVGDTSVVRAVTMGLVFGGASLAVGLLMDGRRG